MKSGPPKTPSALNELRGNPGKRARNADEPKPEAVSSLAPPAWLDAIARATWSDLAPELKRLGLLTVVDVQALAAGCSWWSIYRRAASKLKPGARRRRPRKGAVTTELSPQAGEHELVAWTKANGLQAKAELKIAKTAFDAAMDVFRRFGVTPSERTSLAVPAPKEAGSPRDEQPRDPHDELAARRAARASVADRTPAP